MRRTKPSIFRDIYHQPYDDSTRLKLYTSTKSSLELLQRMSLFETLKVHNGCVNSICWNATGDLILSGSDDQHLVLTNVHNYEVLTHYKTSHRANIFSAKFLPHSGDHRIVSCSGDGIILYTDLMRKTETFNNQFNCHSGTTYEIATIPGEPHNFLSCGEDGTVRWFDLRIKDKCNTSRCKEDVLISCQRAVTAISINPVSPHQIAIGCSDSTVRTFDRRMLATPATGWVDGTAAVNPLYSFTVPEFEGNSYRITSLSYSPDGQDVLVSYSSDHLYLFSMKDQNRKHLRKDSVVNKAKNKKHSLKSPQPVRRLRLRGDWSDTGPNARPEREGGRRSRTEIGQARPVLHTSLMQRMTDVLSRMLNDPATRAALSGGGEDSLEGVIDQQVARHDNDIQRELLEEQNPSDRPDLPGNELTNQPQENEENRNETLTLEEARQYSYIDRDLSFNTSSTTNPDNSLSEESFRNEPTDVPMETDSSQISLPVATQESSETNEASGSSENSSQSNTTNNQEGNMIENLQDKLANMRHGFLEKHGSEPSVSLTYSDRSSTSATISLGVGDELIRENYHAGPSTLHAQSTESEIAGPSSIPDNVQRYDTVDRTEEDAFIDSDDDDTPAQRFSHSIETAMNEAVASARSERSHETFDDSYVTELCVKQKYTGHRNARTMIKEANFWGDDFVMSGSDCGHVFIWERESAKLRMLLQADQHVVNCIQPHPFLPMLATSGIDYDVKVWAPINDEPSFDEKFAEDLKKRNAVMLEETKDTITVPAVFMIRMLACLNQIRRGRGRHRRRSGDEGDDLRGG